MSKLWRTSPKYLTDWADENLAGWGQLTFSYYQLNDAYHTAAFRPSGRLGASAADAADQPHRPGTPRSRADHLSQAMPVNDPTQDSLNRKPSSIVGNADIAWQRTDPGALTVVQDMPEMPHLAARWGIFQVGYKWMLITPFTAEQLVSGYHVGNIDFDGQPSQADYRRAFRDAVLVASESAALRPQDRREPRERRSGSSAAAVAVSRPRLAVVKARDRRRRS